MRWEHEAACWVDGVNHSTATDLCRLIQTISLASHPTAVSFLRLWRDVGLKSKSFPGMLPSTILGQALGDLSRSSREFALLTVQVSSKCLLFDNNSMPLATLIVAKAQEVEARGFGSLVAFAKSILFCDRNDAATKVVLAKQAMESCFSANSSPLNCFTLTSSKKLSCSLLMSDVKRSRANDESTLIRYLMNFASMSNEAGNFPVLDLVGRLLPQAISVSVCKSRRSLLLYPLTSSYFSRLRWHHPRCLSFLFRLWITC